MTLEIARQRLQTQHLIPTPLESAEAVVGFFGAMQAQEYPYAKWSIGQRTPGLTDAAVDGMLAAGTILRTHILRPTWHFVLPADIRWIMSVTAPRVAVFNRHWLRRAELDLRAIARAEEVLGAALTGRRLTRREIQAALAEAGIDASGLRFGLILMQAELDLLIVSGGLRGKQHTYALLDEIASASSTMAPDEALAELTRRYFISHGPSTIADFTWWSSLTVAEVKRGLAMVGSDLERATLEGTDYWSGSQRGPEVEYGGSPIVHLVQGFDESVIGYQKTRSALDLGRMAPKEFVDGFIHPILVDSQIAGFWRRTADKGKAVNRETRAPRFLRCRTRRVAGRGHPLRRVRPATHRTRLRLTTTGEALAVLEYLRVIVVPR